MRSLIKSVIECYGCTNVELASGVFQALKTLNERPIDLAIVDWFMEPLDGIEFVRRVREGGDAPNPYLPIVMLTGHSEAHRVREARDAGANGFVVKPVSSHSIYHRIISLVEDTRPYIRTSTFLGPDRRHINLGPPKGVRERRRS